MKNFKSTIQTARMSDAQLLALGFTQEEIESGAHLPSVSGAVANSSALIADATSAANAVYSATAKAAAIAAAGPIMDIGGNLDLVVDKLQEIKEVLAYVLEGKQTPSNLTGPTGGVITSGADGTTYNLLVGIYQLLV